MRLIIFLLLLCTQNLSAWELPVLSAQETREMAKNGLVHRMWPQKDSPWPESLLLMELNISAHQAAGIFSDYENHKNFIPKILESKIAQTWDQGKKAHVSFVLDIPLMKDSKFTMEDVLEHLGQGAYQIKWSQVESDSSLKSDGHARFYPLGEGKCLFEYHSSVVPKSALAVVLEKLAIKEAKTAFMAIAQHLKETHQRGGDYLKNREAFIQHLFTQPPAITQTH